MKRDKHRPISHSLDYYDQYERSNTHSKFKDKPSDGFVLTAVVVFLLFVMGAIVIGM